MTKITRLFVCCIIFLVTFNCSKKQENQEEGNNGLLQIEVNPKESQTLLLSSIYDSMDYVKLESKNDHLLGEVKQLIATDEVFILQDSRKVITFTKEGKFKYEINNSGKGPGEYNSINCMTIDTLTNQIEILDDTGMKILRYNLDDGKFQNEWKHNLRGFSFFKYDSLTYAIYSGNFINSNSNYMVNFVSTESNEKAIAGHFPIDSDKAKYMLFFDLVNFFYHNKTLNFLSSSSDTIYSVSKDEVSPRIVIDYGKYKIPNEFYDKSFSNVAEYVQEVNKSNYVLRNIGFFESNDHIVFSFRFQNNLNHVYFSKASGKAKVVKKFKDDLRFFNNEIPANFDNLPRFSFKNKFYSILESYTFVSTIDSLKHNLPKEEWEDYKTEHPELMEIYKSSNINENPVICIGKLKHF